MNWISRILKREKKTPTHEKVRGIIKEYYDGESLLNLYYLIDTVEVFNLGESSEVKITTKKTGLIGAMIGSKGKHIRGMKRLLTEKEVIDGDFKVQLN